MLNKSRTRPSEFSASCDAVRLGFELLNTVECLEGSERCERDVRELWKGGEDALRVL